MTPECALIVVVVQGTFNQRGGSIDVHQGAAIDR
jgi:hypothetical protein